MGREPEISSEDAPSTLYRNTLMQVLTIYRQVTTLPHSRLGGRMTDKPKTIRLRREIVLALVLKVALLTFIWAAWFSAPEDRTIDASIISSRLFPQHSQ